MRPIDIAELKVVLGDKVYRPDYIDSRHDSLNCRTDLRIGVHICDEMRYSNALVSAAKKPNVTYRAPNIKKVIFNDPATIVLWADGTKTVVKCSGCEMFDPEKGLAMAMCKKMLGNKGSYYNVFDKYLREYFEQTNARK